MPSYISKTYVRIAMENLIESRLHTWLNFVSIRIQTPFRPFFRGEFKESNAFSSQWTADKAWVWQFSPVCDYFWKYMENFLKAKCI